MLTAFLKYLLLEGEPGTKFFFCLEIINDLFIQLIGLSFMSGGRILRILRMLRALRSLRRFVN